MSKNTDVAQIKSTVDALATTVSGKADGVHNHDGVYEPADATILKDADIGISVASQGHNHDGTYEPADATILKSANIGISVAAQAHNHDGTYEPVFTKNTAFNKNFGSNAGDVSEGNHNHTGTYEPADATILKDADIGVNVQAAGSYAASSHNHSGSAITSGTVAAARLGSSPSSSKYLRGDSTWQTINTTPSTSDVLNALKGLSVGAVGTFAFLAYDGTGTVSPGNTKSGSQLHYSDSNGSLGSNVSGTWRCLGYSGNTRSTVYVRIS